MPTRKRVCAAVLAAALFLCAASCGSVKRTKDLSADLTQTQVVLKSDIRTEADFADFLLRWHAGFTVPGLLEGFIPQGICRDTAGKRYYISGYYEDGKLPSAIAVLDGSGVLLSVHPLEDMEGNPSTEHAGGIAYCDGTLFVTGGGSCRTFSAASLKKDGGAVRPESNFALNTAGSFAACDSNILWVGDFVESDDKARRAVAEVTTLDSGETFYAYCEGYELENGLPSQEKINSDGTGYVPDYFLAIPEQVQGMGFTRSGGPVFSTSYGRRNNSVLLRFSDVLAADKVGTKTVDGQPVDLFACSTGLLKETLTAPPMAEGMCSYNGQLTLLFESGAAKYRSHGGKFPVDTVYTATYEE